MKKFLIFFKIFISLFLSFFPIYFANAAFLGPIIPDDCITGRQGCNVCDLFKVSSNVVNYLSVIVISLAALMIVIGGIYMVIPSPSNFEKGKKYISKALIGVILALSAWLIIDTVIKILVGNLGSSGPAQLRGLGQPWNSFTCPAVPSSPSGGGPNHGGPPLGGGPPSEGGQNPLTEADARELLSKYGIDVNNNCGNRYASSGTGTCLSNIREATLSEAIDLKKECGCDLVITAGTEKDGHTIDNVNNYDHFHGYKFDARADPSLNAYIENNFQSIASRHDGTPQWKAPDGSIYALESNPSHWDILVGPGANPQLISI